MERNLDRVAGHPLTATQRRRGVTATFDHYARYWHELFRLAVEDPAPLVEDFVCDGLERLDAAAASGHGVILALPHLGHWDLGGAWLARQGYQITVVAETLDPPELFDWFVATRTRLGLRVLALGPDAGPPGTPRAARRTHRVPAVRPRHQR